MHLMSSQPKRASLLHQQLAVAAAVVVVEEGEDESSGYHGEQRMRVESEGATESRAREGWRGRRQAHGGGLC